MDNVEIKKSNLEAAYKQADDNTKKLLATLFGDAVTTKDDRPVTERIKTFEDAMAALDSNHPFVCDFRAFCAQSDDISPDMLAYLKLRIIRSKGHRTNYLRHYRQHKVARSDIQTNGLYQNAH